MPEKLNRYFGSTSGMLLALLNAGMQFERSVSYN